MRGFRLSKRGTKIVIGLMILLISAIYQSFQPKNQKADPSKSSPTRSASDSAKTIPADTELYLVKKVIDGDTIELENGQTVRYIGIDTPETKHPQKRLQCFGREASQKNRELVGDRMVRLEKDVSETDRYSRLLRYVFVPTESSPSGLFVNDFLVKEGFAHAATFPPDVRYADHFRNLEREAQSNNRGLWQSCK